MREEFKSHSRLYKENQILSCEENGRKLQLKTKGASFFLVKIDGGVEQDDINKKCDFLVIKTTNEDIWIYIELKGNKLEDACKQIQATYDKYKQSNALKYIAIVASRFPKGDTSIQDLKESLKKRGVKKIFHKEVTLELTYNRNDFKNPIKKTN